ncbi:MAG: putative baseplate assembly protein, partial [Actinomycetota bacterium]
MIYVCCNRKRGEAVRLHPILNGIEYLEVLDDDAPTGSPRQRTIVVRCYKPVGGLDGDNVRIEGGTRIRPVDVEWAFPADTIAAQGVLTPAEAAFVAGLEDPAQLLIVRTAVYGDFSTYTFRLVAGAGLDQPPADFDPVLSSVEFLFKAECPTPFDCYRPRVCPPEARETPLFSYLAKDYASFRGLMLDRLALLVPRWSERNPADLGVALVELLAYAGDSLSYRQDAVATEAYLDTARRRVSVRRHARLVDYFMHDGSNARCWVQVQAQGVPLTIPAGTQILSRASGLAGPVVTKGSREYLRALNAGAAVFETMHRAVLYPANNTLFFYTWGDEACALPACATRATLKDGATPAQRLLFRAGDVLVLEERLGPETGSPSDADPTRRHAVRLTKVEPEAALTLTDGVETGRNPAASIQDPLTGQPIVKIEWGKEDALPFPLCISSPRTDTELADQVFEDVSVARGNLVLT